MFTNGVLIVWPQEKRLTTWHNIGLGVKINVKKLHQNSFLSSGVGQVFTPEYFTPSILIFTFRSIEFPYRNFNVNVIFINQKFALKFKPGHILYHYVLLFALNVLELFVWIMLVFVYSIHRVWMHNFFAFLLQVYVRRFIIVINVESNTKYRTDPT